MKKLVSLILIALLLLALTACGGDPAQNSENAPESARESEPQQSEPEVSEPEIGFTEESSRELYSKLTEVNCTAAVFGRHEALTIHWYWPAYDYSVMTYETKDFIFRDRDNGSIDYTTEKYIYNCTVSEESGSNLGVTLDVSGKGLNHDQIVPEDAEAFYDKEHEHYYDAYIEDGTVVVVSEYDEQSSRSKIEEYTGETDSEGWTVYSTVCYDPGNYEIQNMTYFMKKGDESVEISRITYAYDEPVPHAVYILRAAFERSSRNMMTVTAVADAGTDREIKSSVTVPKNIECYYTVGGKTAVYFYDADYSTLYRWDRMSSLTMYIVTDPSEELVDRFNELLANLPPVSE